MREGINIVYEREDGSQFIGKPNRSYEHANVGIHYTLLYSDNKPVYAIKWKLKGENPNKINLGRC